MYAVHFSPTKAEATFDTFAEAEAYVRTKYAPVHFEVDPDHPECADFICAGLVIGCIEGPRHA